MTGYITRTVTGEYEPTKYYACAANAESTIIKNQTVPCGSEGSTDATLTYTKEEFYSCAKTQSDSVDGMKTTEGSKCTSYSDWSDVSTTACDTSKPELCKSQTRTLYYWYKEVANATTIDFSNNPALYEGIKATISKTVIKNAEINYLENENEKKYIMVIGDISKIKTLRFKNVYPIVTIDELSKFTGLEELVLKDNKIEKKPLKKQPPIILEAKNISKTYQAKNGEIQALKDINFKVKQGEYISIIGPSGCGKSTLLSIIAGLESKSQGTIIKRGKIGYMLQKDNLLEWRTIYKNVLLGLEIQKNNTKENSEYAINLLKKYGLYEFKDKYPMQLSGGMRQRVALIRTLAIRPQILLLDEAFSALDYQTRLMVTDDIYKILKQEGITAIMVTHDISEAISMSDRVIVLSQRPATVKNIYNIEFDIEHRTPLNCRESPQFSKYFNTMWKELEEYDKEAEKK